MPDLTTRLAGYAETVELSKACVVVVGARRATLPRLGFPDLRVEALDVDPVLMTLLERAAQSARAAGTPVRFAFTVSNFTLEAGVAPVERLLDALRRAAAFSEGRADG